MSIIKSIAINQFNGAFHFLSNFYLTPIVIEDITYASSEHAYQAKKFLKGTAERESVIAMDTPSGAKREADRITKKLLLPQADEADRAAILTPDWQQRKATFMMRILNVKFAPGSELAELLAKTDKLHLLEGNYWHDNVWGSCEPRFRPRNRSITCSDACLGRGENGLGKILMAIRHSLPVPLAE
jgi:ribA/ribD-fused uncharacterized protein|tara:strand:+ start:709 stop:1263 length:555 start_codon:yes stop_codon:yes gene_type:complete